MFGVLVWMKTDWYEKKVAPTVTYGPEAWGMRIDDRSKLDVSEMERLRRRCGVSTMDRRRNEEENNYYVE